MTNKQKIKCLFEHHDYKIQRKSNSGILMCKHCMRFGYRRSATGLQAWFEYNEEGNLIHYRESTEFEVWWKYDERGNRTHYKNSWGTEVRYDRQGSVVYKKDGKQVK